MERITDEAWRNFDPWEFCGQDDYCQRGCHQEGGCANGCRVPKMARQLARYEDTGLTPEEVSEMKKDLDAIVSMYVVSKRLEEHKDPMSFFKGLADFCVLRQRLSEACAKGIDEKISVASTLDVKEACKTCDVKECPEWGKDYSKDIIKSCDWPIETPVDEKDGTIRFKVNYLDDDSNLRISQYTGSYKQIKDMLTSPDFIPWKDYMIEWIMDGDNVVFSYLQSNTPVSIEDLIAIASGYSYKHDTDEKQPEEAKAASSGEEKRVVQSAFLDHDIYT